jgi:hypothetical protein
VSDSPRIPRYEFPTGPTRYWLDGSVTTDKHTYVHAEHYDALAASCSQAAKDAVQFQDERDALKARCEALEAAIKPFAEIPIEDFDWQRKPDHAFCGWNKHTLHVRDVLAARSALADGGGQ